jgi:hypothetical protein
LRQEFGSRTLQGQLLRLFGPREYPRELEGASLEERTAMKLLLGFELDKDERRAYKRMRRHGKGRKKGRTTHRN